MHDANNKRETSSASYSQDHLPHSLYSSLFIDLCEDVRVLEEVIFLINPASAYHQSIGRIAGRLSRTTVNRRSGSSDPCSVLRAQAPTHLLADFDRIPTPTRQQHPIPRLNRGRHDRPVLVGCSGANGDDGRFWQRGLCG